MAGFADVARLALQPSALTLDPTFSRQLLQRDLDRTQQQGRTQRATTARDDRARFNADLRQRKNDATRHGKTLPARESRYTPPGNPQQSLLDAILKDQALAQYDRDAPLEREALRAFRP